MSDEDDLYVPQEICKDILSRLPIRSILRVKCVYKPWRDLIEGGEFATSYTPKPCLAFDYGLGYAICDETFQPLLQFNFPRCDKGSRRAVINSVNGLLLLMNRCDNVLSVCNPMTRECIELPPLRTLTCHLETLARKGLMLGFGVSKLSGQYKILCVTNRYISCNCEIYTLENGGGLWRSITEPTPCTNVLHYLDTAAFFNGNLHWLAIFSDTTLVCRCLDLETELFTSFFPPRSDAGRYLEYFDGTYRLCNLEGQLCFCSILTHERVAIWCMNNYGDDNPWTKKYSFYPPIDVLGLAVFPLYVLPNGDLLFAVDSKNQLYIYSKNSRTVTSGLLKRFLYCSSHIVVYNPNFVSLKSMGIHNVQALTI